MIIFPNPYNPYKYDFTLPVKTNNGTEVSSPQLSMDDVSMPRTVSDLFQNIQSVIIFAPAFCVCLSYAIMRKVEIQQENQLLNSRVQRGIRIDCLLHAVDIWLID